MPFGLLIFKRTKNRFYFTKTISLVYTRVERDREIWEKPRPRNAETRKPETETETNFFNRDRDREKPRNFPRKKIKKKKLKFWKFSLKSRDFGLDEVLGTFFLLS